MCLEPCSQNQCGKTLKIPKCPYLCASNLPDERLRVFISSAQNDEDGFEWKEIRKKIKSYLNQCPYINPFIIEETASSASSVSFFQRQVERTDVVVFLIRGEVRQGTQIEYNLAKSKKKPILVYFLECKNRSLAVEVLKRDVEKSDRCTYENVTDCSNLEVQIQNALLNDMVRNYQDKFYESATDAVVQAEPNIENTRAELGVLSKTAFSLFDSSYNHIYDLLHLAVFKRERPTNESPFHHLGEAALDWLILGKTTIETCDLLSLIDKTSKLYIDNTWLMPRWDAIQCAWNGEYEKALEFEETALSKAKYTQQPQWLINDILIDCRSLQGEFRQSKHEIKFESEFQNEILKSETPIYLPLSDRYLENAYEKVIETELKVATASPYTTFFGSSLGGAIHEVENYLFSAMLYGSYTHMRLAQKVLAQILYKYAILMDDASILYQSFRLFILAEEREMASNILKRNWSQLYATVSTDADELWMMAKNSPVASRDNTKMTILKIIGQYLSDGVFLEAEEYLISFADAVYWGNSEEYWECLSALVLRLNVEKITVSIAKIICEKRFHIGSTLSHLLCKLPIEKASAEVQQVLCNALKEETPFIIKQCGSPQYIAALVIRNFEVFSCLATLPDNGLIGDQKLLYDINLEVGNWTPYLGKQIDGAVRELESNQNEGCYAASAYNYYNEIKKAVTKNYQPEMAELIVNRFYPLCKDVLTSKAATVIKTRCANCLSEILISAEGMVSSLPVELKTLLSDFRSLNIQSPAVSFFGSKSVYVAQLEVLRYVIGITSLQNFLECFYDYSQHEPKERIGLASCLSQVLKYEAKQNKTVDSALLLLLHQCMNDAEEDVILSASSCFPELLETNMRNVAVNSLNSMIISPMPSVRIAVLNMCIRDTIKDEEVRKGILQTLQNDAHYAVRTRANEVLSEKLTTA